MPATIASANTEIQEQKLQEAISRLTCIEISWKLPFEPKTTRGGKRKKGLRCYCAQGKLIQQLEFGIIDLAQYVRFEVEEIRGIADIEFADGNTMLPMFLCGNLVMSYAPLRLDLSAWRICQSNEFVFCRT